MDEMKLRSALAMLQAINDKLPNGDIEEKYVALYHKATTDIQDQLGVDLSAFFIPDGELKRQVTSGL